jgi:hypothetical protein
MKKKLGDIPALVSPLTSGDSYAWSDPEVNSTLLGEKWAYLLLSYGPSRLVLTNDVLKYPLVLRIISQVFKKFPTFYATGWLITTLTKAHHRANFFKPCGASDIAFIPNFSIRVSIGTSTILIEDYRDFPQSFRENYWVRVEKER